MSIENLGQTHVEESGEVQQLRATVLELGKIAEERGIEIQELEEYKKLALLDDLLGDIGIKNRRGFEKELSQTKGERSRRESDKEDYEKNLSIIFLDIDDFKSINDTYGHEAGDEVLKGLARIIKEEARESDTFAGRVGGDEIAIGLPGADEKGATEFLKRIKERVAKTEVQFKGKVIKFTISGGVDEGGSIGKADEKMYRDKEEGGKEVEGETESWRVW